MSFLNKWLSRNRKTALREQRQAFSPGAGGSDVCQSGVSWAVGEAIESWYGSCGLAYNANLTQQQDQMVREINNAATHFLKSLERTYTEKNYVCREIYNLLDDQAAAFGSKYPCNVQ